MKRIFTLIIIITILRLKSVKSEECFRGAVYTHFVWGNVLIDNVTHIIDKNLNAYEKAAKEASSMGAKIIVYPEDGIIDPTGSTKTTAKQFIEMIPDPHMGTHNPCDEPNQYETRQILYRLSCMAKHNNIYVVADMGDFVSCDKNIDKKCPSDNHYQFNTAVAFDTKGNLIAKYHKMHPYLEYYYDAAPKPDLVYFDTPFGRMGLYICFDILYHQPGIKLIEEYNVTTMLFPTYWFDELPLIVANQIQESWAFVNRVNLLAANVNVPITGSVGSGIYSGTNGAIIYSHIPDGKSRLLIADIPIQSENKDAFCIKNPSAKIVPIENEDTNDRKSYHYKNMDMNGFILKKLHKKSDSIQLCDNDFCCHLNYSVESETTLSTESYFFGVVNRTGENLDKHYHVCQEICSVIRCDGHSRDSCSSFPLSVKNTVFKHLELNGKFSTNYVYPSIITNDFQLLPLDKWKYNKTNNGAAKVIHLKMNEFSGPIISANLYGRCYNRDPPFVP